jgi:hypothetical protein
MVVRYISVNIINVRGLIRRFLFYKNVLRWLVSLYKGVQEMWN